MGYYQNIEIEEQERFERDMNTRETYERPAKGSPAIFGWLLIWAAILTGAVVFMAATILMGAIL